MKGLALNLRGNNRSHVSPQPKAIVIFTSFSTLNPVFRGQTWILNQGMYIYAHHTIPQTNNLLMINYTTIHQTIAFIGVIVPHMDNFLYTICSDDLKVCTCSLSWGSGGTTCRFFSGRYYDHIYIHIDLHNNNNNNNDNNNGNNYIKKKEK